MQRELLHNTSQWINYANDEIRHTFSSVMAKHWAPDKMIMLSHILL